MANELEGSAHLYRTLNERLPSGDKHGEIELYYELLSAGHSVGEILSGIGPVQSKTGHGDAAIAEYPQSGPAEIKPDGVASDVTSEAALAEAARANARGTSGPTMLRDTERRGTDEPRAIASAPPDEPGSDRREQRLRADPPGSEPDSATTAGAHPSIGRETAPLSGALERLWAGRFPGGAKRVAFAALYTVAVASASIAGFSIVRGGRDAEPTITRVQSNPSGGSGTEAVAMPGLPTDRPEAVAEPLKPEMQGVSTAISQAPETSRSDEPGAQSREPGAAVSEPLQLVPVGVQETATATRHEAEAPQQPDAGEPGAVEKSPAAAAAATPSDPTHEPVPPIAQSPSAILPGAPNAVPHPETGQPETGGQSEATFKDEAKATPTVPAAVPTRNVPIRKLSAALPPRAPLISRGRASMPHPNAESRRPVRRRSPARHPRPVYYGQSPEASYTGQRAGSYYPEAARGYGYGAYGPSPYSDTGN
jgi:hypothetical protein